MRNPGSAVLKWFADSSLLMVATAMLFFAGASSTRGLTYTDAGLNDICLLDERTAWVVGDRGVILHTADGGRTWEHQISPFEGSLTGVNFVSAQVGWVVGGATRPHTRGSQGVLLVTSDGGQTWKRLPGETLPALESVKFFDTAHGIVVGRASSMQSSGVFVTSDGGLSWQSVPGGRGWSWRTGDFIDPLTGAVAGRGLWAAVARRTLQVPQGETSRLRAIHDISLVPPTGGWAAGDGGLVLTTADLGHNWFEPQASLPDHVVRHFDLRTIATHDANVWAAGAPGSRVFHSPDAGRTWHSFATGTALPISAMQFADDHHGIAVGALGVILTTRDGGRSWNISRGEAKRTPLLVVAARPDAIAWEAIVHASEDEGYLSSSVVLFRDPPEETHHDAAPFALAGGASDVIEVRLREATLLAGGTASERSWRFPLTRNVPRRSSDVATGPSAGLLSHERPNSLASSSSSDFPDILAELDRRTDGRALELLEAYLVRQIRTWRPDVILLGGSATEPTAESRFVEQLVRTSTAVAGDPTRFVDLAADAGLVAWKVKRIFTVMGGADASTVSILGSSYISRRGSHIGEISEQCRSVVALAESSLADKVSIRLIYPPEAEGARLRTMFDGIDLPRGGDGRRTATTLEDPLLRQAAGQAERRRNVHAVLNDQTGSEALVGHLSTLTQDMDAASKARVLYRLAEGYRTTGRRALAAEMFEKLVRDHSTCDLVDAALVWLVQYYAGSETKWKNQKRGDKSQTAGSATGVIRELGQTTRDDGRVVDWDQKAIEIGRLAIELQPQLALEPQVGVPLASAHRRLGLTNNADRYMLLLRQRGAGDAWQHLAQTERWLAEPGEYPPILPIWTCRRTSERPHLDGVLDEAFWRAARTIALRTSDAVSNEDPDRDSHVPAPGRAELQLAYDEAFLYLAIRATSVVQGEDRKTVGGTITSAEGGEPDSTESVRRRDEDLTGRDRVTIALDLDRDLTTFYEFTLDRRGHVHEQAWHDPGWNPQWYVARAASAAEWTLEAAIPLEELSETLPQARDVWCASAARILPNGSVSSWHGPGTAAPVPASFGLVIFE